MNKCVRCDAETENVFEDSRLWVERSELIIHARYLCNDCIDYIINAFEKFTATENEEEKD
jgi:hypothetical protein